MKKKNFSKKDKPAESHTQRQPLPLKTSRPFSYPIPPAENQPNLQSSKPSFLSVLRKVYPNPRFDIANTQKTNNTALKKKKNPSPPSLPLPPHYTPFSGSMENSMDRHVRTSYFTSKLPSPLDFRKRKKERNFKVEEHWIKTGEREIQSGGRGT